MILKEPTILAHTVATLDELSNGRAECVYSVGNIAMLDQYHIDWQSGGQIKRLREAHHVMRTMLDEGEDRLRRRVLPLHGAVHVRPPVQERVPLKIGAMSGPRSFELAGEIRTGCTRHSPIRREAIEFASEHVRIGAAQAGRDPPTSTSAPGW